MSDQKYILENRLAVPADLLTWARWFETADRRVARDKVNGAEASTVFLAIDQSYVRDGVPLLFETMIFGGEHDQYTKHSATWDEAEAAHARAVSMMREAA